MARQSITITQLTRDGVAQIAQVTALAADGLELPATVDRNVLVEVENTDASTQTVTVLTNASSDGFALEDLVISLTTGQVKVFRLFEDFDIDSFVQADGKVYIDVSDDSTLMFRAYRL